MLALQEEKNRKSPEGKLVDRTSESVGRAGLVYLTPEAATNKNQVRRNVY